MDITGKTAIVTGGSKGIGYSIAEHLADAGANVVISARTQNEVEAAAKELTDKGGGRVVGIRCDVQSYEEVRDMVQRTVDEFGGLDILINNAGVGLYSPAGDIAVEDWQRVIRTNLDGVFYCCKEAIPHLRKTGDGWIINIGSLAGKNPMKGGAAYNASKFGLVGFSEALMMDVRHDGIRVNYIMPGSVDTYFNNSEPNPADDWKLQPDDIARVVMNLLDFPGNALPSRVEIRPSQPPRK